MSEHNVAISAYLTRPRRAMRHACVEGARRLAWSKPACEDCPLRQICAKAIGDLERGSTH